MSKYQNIHNLNLHTINYKDFDLSELHSLYMEMWSHHPPESRKYIMKNDSRFVRMKMPRPKGGLINGSFPPPDNTNCEDITPEEAKKEMLEFLDSIAIQPTD